MSIPQTPSPLSAIIAAKTYNAAWFTGPTKETQIQNAINAAATDGALYVFVPANMIPYGASGVVFNNAVRMIREGSDPTTFDVGAYGAALDKLTDDGAAVQAAINAMGSSSTMGYGRLKITGPACIYGNILIDRKWIDIDMCNTGSLVWNGPDNVSMVTIKRSWNVTGTNMRFLNRHATNKPKAAIEVNVTTGDSPVPTRYSLSKFVIGGDGFDPGTRGAFYNGIITSGNNLQCDQSSISDFSITGCTANGILLLNSQNVFWNIKDGTINAGLTANGISTAAKHTTLSSIFFQTNGVDINLVGDARVIATDIGSEISSRFVVAATAGQFICRGGYWQARSVNQAADAQIIQMQGGVVLELENFEFTDNGAIGTLPKIWLRGAYVSLRLKECDKFPGTTWNTWLDQEPNGVGNYRIIDVSGPGGSFRNEYIFAEDVGDGTTAVLDPLRYDFAPNVRVRRDPWIAPALQNTWANVGSGQATAGYYKDKMNEVHVKGGITGGTTTDGTLLFTLPVGYRPAQQRFFKAHGTANAIRIFTDGTVKLEGVSGATIYLDNIQFRAEA